MNQNCQSSVHCSGPTTWLSRRAVLHRYWPVTAATPAIQTAAGTTIAASAPSTRPTRTRPVEPARTKRDRLYPATASSTCAPPGTSTRSQCVTTTARIASARSNDGTSVGTQPRRLGGRAAAARSRALRRCQSWGSVPRWSASRVDASTKDSESPASDTKLSSAVASGRASTTASRSRTEAAVGGASVGRPAAGTSNRACSPSAAWSGLPFAVVGNESTRSTRTAPGGRPVASATRSRTRSWPRDRSRNTTSRSASSGAATTRASWPASRSEASRRSRSSRSPKTLAKRLEPADDLPQTVVAVPPEVAGAQLARPCRRGRGPAALRRSRASRCGPCRRARRRPRAARRRPDAPARPAGAHRAPGRRPRRGAARPGAGGR